MSEDLISRQDAIDALCFVCGYNCDEADVEDCAEHLALKNVPSAEPERRWIPISEKLPDKEGWYLVTDDSGGVLWLEVEHYDPEVGLTPFCTVQNPVAWMLLPEPYKEGGNE